MQATQLLGIVPGVIVIFWIKTEQNFCGFQKKPMKLKQRINVLLKKR